MYWTNIYPVQSTLDAAEVNYIPFLEWEKDYPDGWESPIVYSISGYSVSVVALSSTFVELSLAIIPEEWSQTLVVFTLL
mgnify:FL=1